MKTFGRQSVTITILVFEWFHDNGYSIYIYIALWFYVNESRGANVSLCIAVICRDDDELWFDFFIVGVENFGLSLLTFYFHFHGYLQKKNVLEDYSNIQSVCVCMVAQSFSFTFVFVVAVCDI